MLFTFFIYKLLLFFFITALNKIIISIISNYIKAFYKGLNDLIKIFNIKILKYYKLKFYI